jgi:hypothetical protein
MGIYEGEEEILAFANYHHDGSHGRINSVDTRFSRSAFYLYLVLI